MNYCQSRRHKSESGMLGETAPAKLYRFFTVSLPKTAVKDGKITRTGGAVSLFSPAANCQRAKVISRQ
jgi:hypothetical protein